MLLYVVHLGPISVIRWTVVVLQGLCSNNTYCTLCVASLCTQSSLTCPIGSTSTSFPHLATFYHPSSTTLSNPALSPENFVLLHPFTQRYSDFFPDTNKTPSLLCFRLFCDPITYLMCTWTSLFIFLEPPVCPSTSLLPPSGPSLKT